LRDLNIGGDRIGGHELEGRHGGVGMEKGSWEEGRERDGGGTRGKGA
jgi:hypothetical protein